MATVDKPSINEPNDRDPHNNNSYGTLVDSAPQELDLPVLNVEDFNERIIRSYESGGAEKSLDADLSVARSLVPAGTAAFRDFSYVAPEIPEYITENCTGCMDCVTQCPDTAILGKVLSESELNTKLADIEDETDREMFAKQWAKTRKYYDAPQKKGNEGGRFAILIDPSKCKGCAECVTVCDDLALEMIPKSEKTMEDIRKSHRFFKEFGPSDSTYINDKLLIDMMLKEETHIYVGGAGSCAGCGEGTALRMMCSATGAMHGDQWGIVAATGCNTVYTSTYPYNPYLVPWTNSLFENAPADAMGVRARWDQMGKEEQPIWCIGGDGAMFDIGFQSLSRMLATGMNINAFILDTQVYSNTGGQASTATFMGQNAKMSLHGKKYKGKQERRKEMAQIAIMHPNTFVAQTTCAHTNHFYKSVIRALEYDGPSVIICYTTCQPEHGVADNMAADQARLAVDSRAFPMMTYDPEAGATIKERMSLQGNPGMKNDWWTNPKTKEEVNFIDFCRSEGRFAKHFDKDGNPSEILLAAQQERLDNWHVLQELAGLI
ncbi:MAG: thiamine pyrophosphate-binding protein [Planctomycetaceae bacterium]|jgi:pyruvate ferredoxin oxidoreductase beta subunit|nr:thiamine pyrophosphate-binding protein [Planctomycetaceae bacterium]MBT4011292.1 thiamine pyrophosphate-binding protein [Planctomycetaceae bacterium]MBT4724115.1 thiamine pyrophosphate-binding protein [Planctomycetaceae bacterium]MBT5123154.1 thiamine pyrophosphate-binding protein [Planctomycetaceae bacterium]MBT5599588.1 thiamine pyrophosphate-binding protein [Planctomycetaceae bacterium]